MPKLQAITQPLPLAKIAYERLRESILTGQLHPGEICNEMALAKELGISRTPVREALLELSSQGLVTFLPRKGVQVNRPTNRKIKEIFELRRAIELATIEKVAKASSSRNLIKIEKALNEQRKAIRNKDLSAFIGADRSFHSTFAELTNNRHFVDILDNIRDIIHLMAIEAMSIENRGEEVITEHEKVFEAVKQRNIIRAKETMKGHLDRSEEAVLKAISSQAEE